MFGILPVVILFALSSHHCEVNILRGTHFTRFAMVPDGIMMIFSPTKTFDLTASNKFMEHRTIPDCNPKQTDEIVALMKQQTKGDLAKLLRLSANLANTAYEYWSSFELDYTQRHEDHVKPAVFTFSGAAYQGLQAVQCSDAAIEYMQSNLRILDPVYGILKPLDLMQPYRLEMNTKHVFTDKRIKLANWWKNDITMVLSKELETRSSKILLNLASDEYSAAVDQNLLPEGTQFIKIVFWEEGKTIAIHTKKARGLMVRFIAENNIQEIDNLRGFSDDGYSFVSDISNDSMLIFNRKAQGPAKIGAPREAIVMESSTKKARSK